MSRTLGLVPRYEPALVELMPAAARTDFLYWRRLLEPLLKRCKGVNPTLRQIAAQTGQPFRTVRNRYYRGRKYGLFGIVDRRLAGKRWWETQKRRDVCPVSESRGLQELWKALCESNGRKSKPEFETLVTMWKKRDPRIAAIPEYADFPGWPRLPAGWSYENLMRYGPTEYELEAARRGRFAATSQFVYTTRKGLWVGSHYLFDDKWHDVFVNSFAEMQHGRPLEVYSLDLFSAKKLRWATRVRTKDQEGNYKGIAEVMMRFILAATLYLDGYSPRGTTILSEHGTAAVRDRLKEVLLEATDKKVVVSESGITGEAAHLGQYPGLVRGNPRHKAALESNNNIEHNALASAPGQTGRNVEERPEELAGRLDYNAALLAVYGELSPERAALLDFPVWEYNQYLDFAGEVYARIAQRRDHELEGWIEAGNVLQSYVWGDQHLLETHLSPEQRAKIPTLLEAGLLTAKPVRMTRQEVWDRGKSELVRIPGWAVCAILGDDLARDARITGNEFTIQDQEIGPAVYRYEPFVTTLEGRVEQLRDGETYEVFINPFALGTLFVRDARGCYLGEAKQIYVPSRADVAGVQRAIADASRRETQLLAPLRARHMSKARERLERARKNAEVVAAADDSLSMPSRPSADRTARNAARAAALAKAAEQQMGSAAG